MGRGARTEMDARKPMGFARSFTAMRQNASPGSGRRREDRLLAEKERHNVLAGLARLNGLPVNGEALMFPKESCMCRWIEHHFCHVVRQRIAVTIGVVDHFRRRTLQRFVLDLALIDQLHRYLHAAA
jgi:hypothetical protein